MNRYDMFMLDGKFYPGIPWESVREANPRDVAFVVRVGRGAVEDGDRLEFYWPQLNLCCGLKGWGSMECGYTPWDEIPF